MSEGRAAAVQYWWSMAEQCLESARREFDARAFVFAVNRLYYAVFYAVSALLMDRGLNFKKHSVSQFRPNVTPCHSKHRTSPVC